jgi:hypothetical protein
MLLIKIIKTLILNKLHYISIILIKKVIFELKAVFRSLSS